MNPRHPESTYPSKLDASRCADREDGHTGSGAVCGYRSLATNVVGDGIGAQIDITKQIIGTWE